jgi:hypothetical protein
MSWVAESLSKVAVGSETRHGKGKRVKRRDDVGFPSNVLAYHLYLKIFSPFRADKTFTCMSGLSMNYFRKQNASPSLETWGLLNFGITGSIVGNKCLGLPGMLAEFL